MVVEEIFVNKLMDEFERRLAALYHKLQQEMRDEWDRDLPFDELLFDRWERAESLSCGEGTSIYHNCYIYGDVNIGNNTWIGPQTILDGSGGLTIGNYCSISAGVHIYSHNSVKWALSGGHADYEKAAVSIGNCCYIGAQSVITQGTSIGDHCLIGANSFVNADIPPFSLAFGSPCRVRGEVRLLENGDVEIIVD